MSSAYLTLIRLQPPLNPGRSYNFFSISSLNRLNKYGERIKMFHVHFYFCIFSRFMFYLYAGSLLSVYLIDILPIYFLSLSWKDSLDLDQQSLSIAHCIFFSKYTVNILYLYQFLLNCFMQWRVQARYLALIVGAWVIRYISKVYYILFSNIKWCKNTFICIGLYL